MQLALQAVTRRGGVATIDAAIASLAPAAARRTLTVSVPRASLSTPSSASTSAASAASTAAAAGSSSSATAAAAAASPLSSFGLGAAGGSVRPAARSSRLSSLSAGRPLPSLKHFVLRGQVLSMYRRVLRMARRCPTAEQRAETVAHARSEIEAMRGASDPPHIKALLQEAKHKIDRLETMINLTR